MRKLSFLALCFIAIISTSSCTKESIQSPQITNPTSSNQVSVSYSEWTMDASFSWEDGTVGNDPAKQANWDAFDLTEETISSGGVLVYAKSNIDGSIQAMPTSFFIGSNGTEVDSYSFTAIPGAIFIFHSKSVNGIFETPADTNEMSFRFIFVKSNDVATNARIATNNGSYSLDDLRAFSYEEVISVLGIPK
jgi:hypothetical protein